MLGFAIVDRQPEATATAVWLTTHAGGTTVQHTNAVVIAHDDVRYETKLRALTADRVVVVTEGSEANGLFSAVLALAALDNLAAETAARQELIEKAIGDYAAETKNKNLVVPEYLPSPPPPTELFPEPQLRALAAANYVAAVWSRWLATEDQRLRRTADPRTGKSPWIMPSNLAQPEIAAFPPNFGNALTPEPLPHW